MTALQKEHGKERKGNGFHGCRSSLQPDWVSSAPRYELHTRGLCRLVQASKVQSVWWGLEGPFFPHPKENLGADSIYLYPHQGTSICNTATTVYTSSNILYTHSLTLTMLTADEMWTAHDGKPFSVILSTSTYLPYGSFPCHLMIPLHSQTCSEFYC